MDTARHHVTSQDSHSRLPARHGEDESWDEDGRQVVSSRDGSDQQLHRDEIKVVEPCGVRHLVFSQAEASVETGFQVHTLLLDSRALSPRSQSVLENSLQDSLHESLTAPLAAPLVLAVWNPQQQSTITYLYVHPYDTPPLASPLGRQNKEIITNKHPSPPPANLSLCGYTHLSSLELHHLSNTALYCCAPRDIHGRVPAMHLDGMKKEEVEESQLLATVERPREPGTASSMPPRSPSLDSTRSH
ncbi:hypothetical protein CRENBAI_010300 [Crenichthys baileyi]|uniref:Uncharacterized protein n=1 Tax=Crenichthys baileyi TaxID=28760 RepID=A0AAV9RUB2_9TELE